MLLKYSCGIMSRLNITKDEICEFEGIKISFIKFGNINWKQQKGLKVLSGIIFPIPNQSLYIILFQYDVNKCLNTQQSFKT